MGNIINNNRLTEAEIDSMFYDRWSPRSFSSETLTDEQIKSLFEAARWSPSCFNEQPWLFLYATNEEDRKLFLTALAEKNQSWAKNAPLLIFLCVKLNFDYNNKPNSHAQFDAGAAWLSLALQARKLGLYSHAMAGFDKDKALEITNTPKDKYDVIAAIAVGYRDNSSLLNNEELIKMEEPNNRVSLKNIFIEKAFS